MGQGVRVFWKRRTLHTSACRPVNEGARSVDTGQGSDAGALGPLRAPLQRPGLWAPPGGCSWPVGASNASHCQTSDDSCLGQTAIRVIVLFRQPDFTA